MVLSQTLSFFWWQLVTQLSAAVGVALSARAYFSEMRMRYMLRPYFLHKILNFW